MATRLYMKPGSTVYALDLPSGATLEVLDATRERVAVDAPESRGPMYRVSFGARWTVKVELRYALANNDLKDFHHRLQEWIEYAARGGVVAIARSSAYAGLWPVVDAGGTSLSSPAEGDTTVYLGSDALGYETSPTLGLNDLAVLEAEPPNSQLWPFRVSSYMAGSPRTIGAATACRAASGSNTWARHRDFYPYLSLSAQSLGVPPIVLDQPQAEVYQVSLTFTMHLPEVGL